MIIHIQAIGVLFVLLSLLHIGFPRYFRWREELATLSLINRQMMQVHTLFIAVLVLLIGLLCLSSAGELVDTSLGKRVCMGLGIFWGLRALVQWFGYSARLWRGKRFETLVHIALSVLWIYCTVVFLVAALAFSGH